MKDTDDCPDNEEQLTTIPADYLALLAMTRPLVVAEHSLMSWRGGEICRSGFGIPLEPEDWRAEFAVRRGEIVHRDRSALQITGDEGLATRVEEATTDSAPEIEHAAARLRPPAPRTDSNLQIRIYLGMS